MLLNDKGNTTWLYHLEDGAQNLAYLSHGLTLSIYRKIIFSTYLGASHWNTAFQRRNEPFTFKLELLYILCNCWKSTDVSTAIFQGNLVLSLNRSIVKLSDRSPPLGKRHFVYPAAVMESPSSIIYSSPFQVLRQLSDCKFSAITIIEANG